MPWVSIRRSLTRLLTTQSFPHGSRLLLVHALGEMNGVADRGALVRLALPSQNFTVALFRQRQAQMYAGYNKSVTPLASFISSDQFALARTSNGALVFDFPADYVVWTEPMARLITSVNQLVNSSFRGQLINRSGSPAHSQPAGEKGNRKPRLADSRSRRGAIVQLGRDSILITRSPKKEWPSGLVTLKMKSVALGVGGSWGDGVLTYQGRNYPFRFPA